VLGRCCDEGLCAEFEGGCGCFYRTGTLAAFLSGRISYVMQLGGPSITVNTACSSSVVAIYQACWALADGDCNAGGVNVITSPDMMLGLDHVHFLSPIGQYKSFDASAYGYSRNGRRERRNARM